MLNTQNQTTKNKTPIIFRVIDILNIDPALIDNSQIYKIKLLEWEQFLEIFSRDDILDEKKSLFALKVKNISFSDIKSFVLNESINPKIRQNLLKNIGNISFEEVKDFIFNDIIDGGVREFIFHKVRDLNLGDIGNIKGFSEIDFEKGGINLYNFVVNYKIVKFDISEFSSFILDKKNRYFLRKIISINILPFDIEGNIDIFLDTNLEDDIKKDLLKKAKKLDLKHFLNLVNSYIFLGEELSSLGVDIIQYFDFEDIKKNHEIINYSFIDYIFNSCNSIAFSREILIYLNNNNFPIKFKKAIVSKLTFLSESEFKGEYYSKLDDINLKKYVFSLHFGVNKKFSISYNEDTSISSINKKFRSYSPEERQNNAQYVNYCQKNFLVDIGSSQKDLQYMDKLSSDQRTLVLYLRYGQVGIGENIKLFNLVKSIIFFIESGKSSLFNNLKIVFRDPNLYDSNLEKLVSNKVKISFCSGEQFRDETSFKANVIHLTSGTPFEVYRGSIPIIPESFDGKGDYPFVSHDGSIQSILQSIIDLQDILVLKNNSHKKTNIFLQELLISFAYKIISIFK